MVDCQKVHYLRKEYFMNDNSIGFADCFFSACHSQHNGLLSAHGGIPHIVFDFILHT